LANFLTRFVEAIGTSTMKSMLPEVYFLLEGDESSDKTTEAVALPEDEMITD
jgi:hypothetical protein